ncbi:hypothetical protein [Kitasatospora fiedleri]|uniref:hypothetical protein n=1 Tax=Kitasatospora fiedleri TaxID=2991545 RepID=UPI00249C2A61|nr:hypothetical protein [Kitasatospora fiedleri]
MLQRRSPLPRRLRALCAVLPAAAGLLLPLAASSAASAASAVPHGPRPAVVRPAHPGPATAARPVAAADPAPAPGAPEGSRLPGTGSAGALPLIGLAALGCVLAGLLVLLSKARRRH